MRSLVLSRVTLATTGRLVVLAAVLAFTAPAALALTPAPEELPQTPRVDIDTHLVELTFPVADPDDGVSFSESSFLALRGGGTRLHAASDLMAPKHRAVHAAVDGTISFAPAEEPGYGWMLNLRGDDGLRYSYVHLNNDTPTRDAAGDWVDDDLGGIEHAYAPRIVDAIRSTGSAKGLRVEAGELLGWLGDSGNAKHVASHLHFEIHVTDVDGEYRIDPYPSLRAALDAGRVPPPSTTAAQAGFLDVDPRGTHTPAIERLSDAGIVTGCDATRYCPDTAVTRGDLAVSLAAALDLDTGASADFLDVASAGSRSGAIAAVGDAGIMHGYGDGHFGPDDPLSRAQLATMLVQAFDVPSVSTPVRFDDVTPTNVHAANIAAAHAASLTRGCGDGTRYCGGQSVTRGQIATFLESGLRILR